MAANTHNAMIGGNLAKLRQQSGLTQEDVAGQMRNKYGYKWSKATVWAVESGERPLKLTEAQDVLKCLGLDWIVFLPMLLQGEETSDELEIKRQILRRRFESVGVPELAAAYFDFLLAAAVSTENDEVAREDAESTLDEYGPESLNSYYWGYLKEVLRKHCLAADDAEDDTDDGYNAEWRRTQAVLGDKWGRFLWPDEYYADEDGDK